MDKVQIMDLLTDFIEGKVPKNDRKSKIKAISDSIPESEIDLAIKLCREMFHDPFDPDSKPENAIPGAHGLYTELTARRVGLKEKEGG